ncbi:MAG TPA: H-X9-DG-CTERM domain-containing protein, partial [Capsulimonadaceae bacterium]|nr:H-X9-DG-CTERM domain-containing protein [Capsulimonadaceae bacterium]
NVLPTGAGVSGYSLAKYNSPSKTVLLFEIQGNKFANTANSYGVSLPPTNQLSDQYFGPIGAGTNGYSPAGFGATGSAGWGGGNPLFDLDGAGAFAAGEPLKFATGYMRGTTASDLSIYQAPVGRHQGGANYLMADDHAKFFRPTQVSAGVSNDSPLNCGAPVGAGQPIDAFGIGTMAAGTECNDSTIAATFSLN